MSFTFHLLTETMGKQISLPSVNKIFLAQVPTEPEQAALTSQNHWGVPAEKHTSLQVREEKRGREPGVFSPGIEMRGRGVK